MVVPLYKENLVSSNELVKVELPPWTIWNADVSNLFQGYQLIWYNQIFMFRTPTDATPRFPEKLEISFLYKASGKAMQPKRISDHLHTRIASVHD